MFRKNYLTKYHVFDIVIPMKSITTKTCRLTPSQKENRITELLIFRSIWDSTEHNISKTKRNKMIEKIDHEINFLLNKL
jgi:hypothetical protein